MKDRTLLGTAAGGTVFFAACCFTKLLVILTAAVGVTAWLAWLDYVILPGLAIFLVLTLYAFLRWRSNRQPAVKET